MIYTIAFFTIFISILLTLMRLLKGPHGVDRVMSIDLITTLLGCLIVVYVIKTGELLFIDIPLILSLIAFFGTLMYSRYLETRITK